VLPGLQSIRGIIEVILLVGLVGHEDFEAVGQGNSVVGIFLRHLAGRLSHLIGFFLVAWLGDVSAVLLIAIRTYRLIFQPGDFGTRYQIKPVE